MAKIGYARVSTLEQNKDLQIEALTKAGCEKLFTDEISGSKTERVGLDACLAYLRTGDILVVWKLDRLGRSLKHLMEITARLEERSIGFTSITEHIDTTTPLGKLFFHMMGALAEFERDLIRERTQAGLAVARTHGRHGGRHNKLSAEKVALVRSMYESKNYALPVICEMAGISRTTLYRYVNVDKQEKETPKG